MRPTDINLKPLQDALLDIYKVFRDICAKHHLRHYASGGTALGAMRHGGFIPWDDDMDLEMPRADYERFCELAQGELPEGLRFVCFKNTYGYDYLFSKVMCTDASRIAAVETASGMKLSQGLFVDIFPDDYFPCGRFALLRRLIMRGLLQSVGYYYRGWLHASDAKLRMGAAVGALLSVFYRGLRSYFDYLCAQDALMASCPKEKSDVMGASIWFQRDWLHFRGKFRLSTLDFGEGREVKFDTTTMVVPNKCERYLEAHYGDWRKLPPEDKRVPTHATAICPWASGETSIEKQPILSIVIANFNYGRFIGETIQSIIGQCWGVAKGLDGHPVLGLPNGECVELIVVDGGSTDNSVEVIKKYSSWLTWWCSEKDKGQSDAFNKGFSHATGKFLTWVNADDLMVPGSLLSIVKTMLDHPKCEWFTGNFFRFVPSGKITQIGWGPHYYPKVLQRKNSHVVSFGPSTFFSRRIYDLAGGVDERFHNTMDTFMWVKFIQMGIKQCRIRKMCWAFRLHEGSKTSEFEGHIRDPRLPAQSDRERAIMWEETHYQPSKVTRVLLLLWRVVDLSLLWKLILTLTYRRVRP